MEDRFMNMSRTPVNVFGNTIVAVLLWKWSGKTVQEMDEEASYFTLGVVEEAFGITAMVAWATAFW